MVTSLLLLLACCAGGTIAVVCKPPGTTSCDRFGGPVTDTCVLPIRSGQGMTWIEASRDCEAGGGRLLWTLLQPLLTLFKRLANVNKFNVVYVGLMVSAADDYSSFWKPSLEDESVHTFYHRGIHHIYKHLVYGNRLDLLQSNHWNWLLDNQFTCGSKYTHTCTTNATVDNSTCLEVGCCLKEGRCMYPDVQNMTLSDASVDMSALLTPNIRSCAGLRLLSNSSYVYEAFDCFKPGDNTTAYICQYKCNVASWKETIKKTLVVAQELPEDQPLPWAIIGGSAAGGVVLIGGTVLAAITCIQKKKSNTNSVGPQNPEAEPVPIKQY